MHVLLARFAQLTLQSVVLAVGFIVVVDTGARGGAAGVRDESAQKVYVSVWLGVN